MFECIGIVGVGLIGASLGLAVKRHALAKRIVGIGRRAESLAVAQRIGAIDEARIGFDTPIDHLQLLVLCVPVDRIVETGLRAAPLLSAEALVTDAGSAKSIIVRELERRYSSGPKFVGSHPMAGSEQSGPEAARVDLFRDRNCIVTRTDATPTDALERISGFWRALRMRVVTASPESHDRIVGRTSHLPHLAAAALATMPADSDHPFVGTGFLDATRISAGDAHLWTAIFEQNRAGLLEALDDYLGRLGRFRNALESDKRETLHELLSEGKRRRDALGNRDPL